jgi:hypothetical protein
MRVFYYQYEGRTYTVCVGALNAGANSPIWQNCNTCSWLVPGTWED